MAAIEETLNHLTGLDGIETHAVKFVDVVNLIESLDRIRRD